MGTFLTASFVTAKNTLFSCIFIWGGSLWEVLMKRMRTEVPKFPLGCHHFFHSLMPGVFSSIEDLPQLCFQSVLSTSYILTVPFPSEAPWSVSKLDFVLKP